MESTAPTSRGFALAAAIFEGGLAVLAVAIGWGLGTTPLATLRFDPHAVVWGLVSTLPLLVLFWVCVKLPFRPFKRITRFLNRTVVPLFAESPVVDLAMVAVLAGLGEEMLFRGIIQFAVTLEVGDPHGVWAGLLVSAALFGLLHAITPTYAAMAGLIGIYFGWIWLVSGNLLTPIIAHSVYDFLALLYYVKLRPRSSLHNASNHQGSQLG